MEEECVEQRIRGLGFSPDQERTYLKIFEEFAEIEREYCLDILTASAYNDIVQDNLLLYPGAYTDIEHSMLFGAKNSVLIDPTYHMKDVRDEILYKMKGYGFNPKIREKDDMGLGTGHEINFDSGNQPYSIFLFARDAVGFLNDTGIPKLPIGSFILKNPNKNIEFEMPSLHILGGPSFRKQNIDSLLRGGLYLEAGIREPMPANIEYELEKISDGNIGCYTFYRDDDISVYRSNLWKKK